MRFYPTGGGGGPDLDVITADSDKIVKPYVIVDKDGNPLTGTLPDYSDNGEDASDLRVTDSDSAPAYKSINTQQVTNSDGTTRLVMAVPNRGVYGNSYIVDDQDVVASRVGLTADKLWPGNSILGIDSSRTTMAGGMYTPTSSQQTIACNGKAMTGDITIPGFTMPAANVIKKGVVLNIFGQSVTGTFEGYVASPTDMYYKGNNAYGYTSATSGLYFGSDRIQLTDANWVTIRTSKTLQINAYSGFIVNFNLTGTKYYSDTGYYIARVVLFNGTSTSIIAQSETNINKGDTKDLYVDVSVLTGSIAPSFELTVKFYDDASGSDSDPSWIAGPFSGNIFRVRVA